MLRGFGRGRREAEDRQTTARSDRVENAWRIGKELAEWIEFIGI
jgi:hypothetical protein